MTGNSSAPMPPGTPRSREISHSRAQVKHAVHPQQGQLPAHGAQGCPTQQQGVTPIQAPGGTYLPHMPQHTDAPHALAHQRAQQRKHQELHTFTSLSVCGGKGGCMQRSGQKKRPRWRNAALKGDAMGSIHVPHACLCREKAELFSQPGERFDSGGKIKPLPPGQDALTAVRAPGPAPPAAPAADAAPSPARHSQNPP